MLRPGLQPGLRAIEHSRICRRAHQAQQQPATCTEPTFLQSVILSDHVQGNTKDTSDMLMPQVEASERLDCVRVQDSSIRKDLHGDTLLQSRPADGRSEDEVASVLYDSCLF